MGTFARGVLFCAGMISGAASGNLFYMDRFAAGVAMLSLTAVFLFFAMSDLTYRKKNDDDEIIDALLELRQAQTTLGLMMADNAVDGYKRIGRTMPGIPAELNKLEDDLIPLLSSLGVDRKERERIRQEIDKLRTRSRHGEGRRALMGGRF